MPIDRDGEGPPLRREEAKTSGRGTDDLRATPFTDDVFDDDYYGRKRKGGAFGLIAGVVFGAALAAFAGWYVLGTREASVATGAPGSGGLVRAESMPYKVKPDDPGGLQVENQDKLVYERLDKSATKPAERVENLLPAAEQPKAPPMKKADAAPAQPVQPPQPTASKSDDPLAKLVAKVEGVKAPPPSEKAAAPAPAPVADKPMTPASPAAMAAGKPMTPAAPAPKTEQVAAATPPAPAPAPKATPTSAPAAAAPTPTPPSAPPVVTNVPQSATTAAPPARIPAPPARIPAPPAPTAAPPAPAPTVVAEAPQAAPAAVPAARAPTATPAAVPPGTMFLQLASARSEDAAMGEWKRISAKNGDLIGTLTPSVVAADLGERGTFYRLRAGPVADKPTAEGLCASLASRNVGCIVVRP